MDQVAQLKAERERHSKALNAALDQAALLRQHVDRSSLLSSESVRDRVAVRLIDAPDKDSIEGTTAAETYYQSAGPSAQHDTQRLILEAAKIRHAEAHAQAAADLAADTAALQISAAALNRDEENLRKRFVRKRLSLAAAIEDDARLAGLTEAEILEEVRARGAEIAKRQQLLNSFSTPGPGQQQHGQQQERGSTNKAFSRGRLPGKVMQPAAMSRRKYMKPKQQGAADDDSSSSWRPPGFDTEYGEFKENEEAEDSTDGGMGMEADEADATAVAAVTAANESERDAAVTEGLQGMLKNMSVQRNKGLPSNMHLSDVAAAVYATLPQQQEKLAAIKRGAAVTSTRLKWQTKRPQTYAGDLALTAHQRSIKGFVQSIIDELVSSALAHIAMRPTKQQVAVEIAEWKARKPAALQAISRHVADSIYKEVVDELLAEIASETAAAAAAANAFAFDMLVAAVAFSQGKYDLGFNVGAGQGSAAAAAGAASGYVGQSKPGGVAREAALLQKAAEREAAIQEDMKEDALASGAGPGNRLVIKAGDAAAEIAEEDVYLARRDFTAADSAFAAGLADTASAAGPGQGSGVGGRGKGSQQAKVSARGLYLAGLRGMLWEMRNRRPPDTPYGHTQQLAPHFTQGTASKARRLAVARQRPPLAASAAVWARREVAVGRLEPGGWPHARHLAAAVKERQFWQLVGLKPRMQKASLPGPAVLTNTSLIVPEALGSITALSGCPAGTFLAAGTNRGALLVWDLREDAAVSPWFQVTGTGQLYKRRWWNPWAAKPPRRPAITGFSWSADSYQLAGLDASSNLKVWWMRPEERDDGQSVAELQAKNAPVTPELAVLVTPFMVAISGKAPVEEDDATTAAANAAAVDAADAAAASTSNTSLGQKLGQWLGVSEAQQKGLMREVPARQWKPVFHPAFTIAGTQPTLVIPQVTGDVLSICTDIGGPVLPGFGPTVFAEKAMAPTGIAAASPATAAAGGSSVTAAASSAAAAEGATLPQAVVDFLMPPQAKNPDIVSQAMYRCHDAHVVFLGFLSDAASLLTLDASGQLALWPTTTSQRSGFGWIKPRKRWQLPRSIRTCVPRSGLHPVWPVLPQRGRSAGSNKNKNNWSATASDTSSSWMYDGLEDKDETQAQLLQQDPQGGFLLASRLPWMVRYQPSSTSSSGGGRVVRQVLHRPLDNSAPGSNVLVISSYDAATGELLMRAKQRCTYSRAPVKVVAAEMTGSKRELLVICSIPPQQDDPAATYTFTVSVINLAAMKALVPRIDAPDPSSGTAAPAYALSQTLTSLGTEYLFMNLGCAVIGVYSLATGQLVREIATGVLGSIPGLNGGTPKVGGSNPAGSYFGCLALLRVSEKQGQFSNAGRTLLAASGASGQPVYVLELDVEGAAQRMLKLREEQQERQSVRDSAAPQQPPPALQQVVQQQMLQQQQVLKALPGQRRSGQGLSQRQQPTAAGAASMSLQQQGWPQQQDPRVMQSQRQQPMQDQSQQQRQQQQPGQALPQLQPSMQIRAPLKQTRPP